MLHQALSAAEPVTIPCADGVVLHGHFWKAAHGQCTGTVIVNAATGVIARYYARYAAFLAAHGFDVWTYDYRGIGESRPANLRGCGYRWRDWGEKDFEAVLKVARARAGKAPLLVVGHSIGGVLPGLAESAPAIDRMLTVGAQYAYWPDYAPNRGARLFLKWHVVMPLVTAAFGYFPGKRLGWLEDLPAGVANEWSFRGAKMERSHPRAERPEVLRRFAAVKAPILAVTVSDDEFATPRAVRRALGYYSGAARQEALLSPSNLGMNAVGHFGLFHDRHASGFWLDTLMWLRDGTNPWPGKGFGPSLDTADWDMPPLPPYIRRYY
ncbi:alpha/beta fold hydrolase [Mesorhizobium sp. LHD-90]|uniref:alpha/beta hydrolase family protein n=1 Tax=Mesorhizobium sp. LHD-90 TaxID=3071414 RepID=UPI0027E16ADC|nr:alpha/beta fold hydrolase [Mesorhizobium sp. LHD-90]MDQ6433670.1 alpha/beta fold hydrolase [Mesorhizobium sp. LHD-90]